MKLQGKQILLVEDEEELARVLGESLDEEGSHTTIEASVANSLIQLSQHEFDLIICDANLPDGDYVAIYEAAMTKCPNTIFVLMTGEPQLTVPKELRISTVLHKPEEVLDLGDRIATILKDSA